jgi:membrane-associated HD superfamily phosphohydrolase
MAHIPVNHPMRPLYRMLAGLIGLYILVFGIIGVIQTAGDPLFDRGDVWVLGLRTNLAFAILSIIYGAVLLAGAVIGGNVEHMINLAAGLVFIIVGMIMMTLMQTDGNILNFSMVNSIVSFIFGLLVLTAGLYDKVGSRDDVEAEEAYRRNAAAAAATSSAE